MIEQEIHPVHYQAQGSHYCLIKEAEKEWTREDPHLHIYSQPQNFPILITKGKHYLSSLQLCKKAQAAWTSPLQRGKDKSWDGVQLPNRAAHDSYYTPPHWITRTRNRALLSDVLLLALSLAKSLFLSKGEGG